jgi:hypothetical protein
MNEELMRSRNTESTVGEFNYLQAVVQSSLLRNGKVLTRRDADGSDAGMEGVLLEPKEMVVHNARGLTGGERCTLSGNGFELRTIAPPDRGIDFLNQAEVVQKYYGHCAEIVQEVTGARAFAFDHNVRSASGKRDRQRIAGGQQVQGPAHIVHGDYTLTSAPQRLRDLTKPPTGNDTLRPILGKDRALIRPELAAPALEGAKRFAIINVWRSIAREPVVTNPLALCDSQSVAPEQLVVFEIHYQDRIGENYFAKHSPRHRWFYFPGMTGEEALLIKQWDSAGVLAQSRGAAGDAADANAPCTFSFHSAFDDRATPPDAPDRWSIEVRCMVLYDT